MTAFPWRPPRARVGTVGRAHGLDGSFFVEAECGWWRFATGSDLLVNGAPMRVSRRSGLDTRPIVRLEGHVRREDVEPLRGAVLEVVAADLPAPQPDSYFQFDLIGCSVSWRDRVVGTVTAVEEGVAHDLLVVGDRVRVPFVKAIVPSVDIARRSVVIAADVDLDFRLES